jgi:hypothetical protein
MASSAILLISGCEMGTAIHEVPLNSPPGSMVPREPESVEVFSSQRPSEPYAEIAMIEAEASMYGDAPEVVMTKLREYAAQKGCDAIILNGGWTVTQGRGLMTTTALKGYRVTCVVYTGSDAHHAKAAADPVKSRCDQAYGQIAELARAWAEWRSGRPQTEFPPQSDFLAMCSGMTEQARACLVSSFLRTHHADCDTWLAGQPGSAKERLNDMLVTPDR